MSYDPQQWNTTATNNNPNGPNYTLALPPPNITGQLHMGHLLNATIADILIRYKQMEGYHTTWIPGTDHATTATQSLLDKRLKAEGTDRREIGREAFMEYGQAWREETGSRILHQLHELNMSLDYDRERYTLDEAYQETSATTCHRLYREGLIYRDDRLIWFSPALGSALADLEIIRSEEKTTLYYLAYPLSDGSSLEIATTSLHGIAADSALGISPGHPERDRLEGLQAINPLTNETMPIIIDDRISMEFGSGAMKITPAHDHTDFKIGGDHGLPARNAYDISGYMTDLYEPWAGLSIEQARKLAPAALRDIIIREEDYTQAIPRCERTNCRIETLMAPQWWMRTDTLLEPIITALQDGTITITPDKWRAGLISWLQEGRPWCLSRQLWWGQQIPMWQDNEGNWYDHDGEGYTQDSDTLDTWFTSSLWPLTAGKQYPLDAIISNRDILPIWISRMLMMCYHLTGELPFRNIILHGTILDRHGARMSKSKGTGIDPLTIKAEYGTDAARWGIMSISANQDIRWQDQAPARAGRTLRKLYNACMLIGDITATPAQPSDELQYWIEERFETLLRSYQTGLSEYQWHSMTRALEYFIEKELCPWYLEAYKHDRKNQRAYAQHLLYRTLCLCYPIAPGMTSYLCPDGFTIPTTYEYGDTSKIAATWNAIKDRRANRDHEQPPYGDLYHQMQ